MKKRILKIVFASAFALVAGYSVYASQQKVEMSDLALANVEALANRETGEEFTNATGCVACICDYKCTGKDGKIYKMLIIKTIADLKLI